MACMTDKRHTCITCMTRICHTFNTSHTPFPCRESIVKEQTLRRARRRMQQAHKSPGPWIGCRPRRQEALEKTQGRKTKVTSVAQIGNWVVEDGLPQALKRSR